MRAKRREVKYDRLANAIIKIISSNGISKAKQKKVHEVIRRALAHDARLYYNAGIDDGEERGKGQLAWDIKQLLRIPSDLDDVREEIPQVTNRDY